MCLKKKKNLVKPKEEISLPKKYIKCDGSQDTITKIVQRHKKFLQIILVLKITNTFKFFGLQEKIKKNFNLRLFEKSNSFKYGHAI